MHAPLIHRADRAIAGSGNHFSGDGIRPRRSVRADCYANARITDQVAANDHVTHVAAPADHDTGRRRVFYYVADHACVRFYRDAFAGLVDLFELASLKIAHQIAVQDRNTSADV